MGSSASMHQRQTSVAMATAIVLPECPGLNSSAVRRLYRLFRRADKDRSGSLTVLEFLMHIDVDRTVFAIKAFTAMDVDNDGTVDFCEFVRAAWNFLSLSKDGLRYFAFSLYDIDGSGNIDLREVATMVRELYGKFWKESRLANECIGQLQRDGGIDTQEFVDFAKTHPALLFPAFTLQRQLRKKMGGANMWSSVTSARAARQTPSQQSVRRKARAAHAAAVAPAPPARAPLERRPSAHERRASLPDTQERRSHERRPSLPGKQDRRPSRERRPSLQDRQDRQPSQERRPSLLDRRPSLERAVAERRPSLDGPPSERRPSRDREPASRRPSLDHAVAERRPSLDGPPGRLERQSSHREPQEELRSMIAPALDVLPNRPGSARPGSARYRSSRSVLEAPAANGVPRRSRTSSLEDRPAKEAIAEEYSPRMRASPSKARRAARRAKDSDHQARDENEWQPTRDAGRPPRAAKRSHLAPVKARRIPLSNIFPQPQAASHLSSGGPLERSSGRR
ncbi:hypothetical protein M885DRAFT_469927 [Pelagophyceae sp. CCMP2097]|nr:hypothetical protein M885DRAFT_469927 [Pelagophyceae sp. CCMP2097]